MYKSILLALGGLLTCGAFAFSFRSADDGRAWSVMMGSGPLTWSWAREATAATLTVSNLVNDVVQSADVTRTANALDGSCEIPATSEDSVNLIVVTLVQKSGADEVSRQTARLRLGASADCIVDKTDKSFTQLREPRIFVWSDDWADAAEAETATLTIRVKGGATIGTWELPMTGGYGVIRPKVELAGNTQPLEAIVDFGNEKKLTADIRYVSRGLLVIIR